MGVNLVIDGYNFLRRGASGGGYGLEDLEGEREALVENLSVYKRIKGAKVTVVFDGVHSGRLTGSRERRKGVMVVFSRHGEEADAVIKRMARERGAGITVVTSDRDVAAFAEARGSVVIPSDEFHGYLEMALYTDIKGAGGDDEEDGEVCGAAKKGSAFRSSKKERKKKARTKKL